MEQDRPDTARARQTWADLQPSLDPGRIVFIDETWASTALTRLRGRAQRGHVRTPTRRTGTPRSVKQFLAPGLRSGDTVVADCLGSYKVAGVQAAIEAREATLLHLSLQSRPEPIEQVFAKLKRLVRSAQARTVDALWDTIGKLLDQFSPEECLRYIHRAGYQGQSESTESNGSASVGLAAATLATRKFRPNGPPVLAKQQLKPEETARDIDWKREGLRTCELSPTGRNGSKGASIMHAVATTSTANAKFCRLQPTAWLRRSVEAIRQCVQHRRNLVAVNQMNDYLLRDIGLEQHDTAHPETRVRADGHGLLMAGWGYT